jgi:hypothetical protein
MKNQLQQGDVLITRIESLPYGGYVVPPGNRGHILADGEITGHAHVIPIDHAITTRIGDKLYVTVTAPTFVTHEEHKPIALEPGTYEIGRVREWDYLAHMARTVAD